jgi:cell division protein FtsQ
MTKSKMAVRNKGKPRQYKFDLKVPVSGKPSLKLFGAAIMASALIYVLIVSSNVWQVTWPVNRIELKGNTHYVTNRTINHFMQQQPEAGLLAIDLQELQSQVKKIDWVRKVEIRKVWPDKLIFTIDEFTPVALFGEHVLTSEGTLIEISEIEKFAHLAQIVLSKEREEKRIKHGEIWQEYKVIKRELANINLELSRLEVDHVDNWELSFSNSLILNLGRKNRTQRVKRFLDVFAKIENNKQLKKVDLRYHNGLAVEWFETKNVLQQEVKLKLKS